MDNTLIYGIFSSDTFIATCDQRKAHEAFLNGSEIRVLSARLMSRETSTEHGFLNASVKVLMIDYPEGFSNNGEI